MRLLHKAIDGCSGLRIDFTLEDRSRLVLRRFRWREIQTGSRERTLDAACFVVEMPEATLLQRMTKVQQVD